MKTTSQVKQWFPYYLCLLISIQLLLYLVLYPLSNMINRRKQTPLSSIDNATGYRTCLYYSNWSIYHAKHFPADIPAEVITNLFYSFLTINNVGELKFTDEWADLQIPLSSSKDGLSAANGCVGQLFQLKQRNRSMKISLSIGGWGAEHIFSALSQDANKFNTFIDSSMSFIQEYGFDGIDLDWEYPRNKEEGLFYLEMFRSLRIRMNKLEDQYSMKRGSLLLTLAAPASREHLQHFNIPEMDQYVSFWNLMLYDFSGSWSSTTEYHSNLFGGELSCDSIIQMYLKAGIPPHRLIMGMPLYGRGFSNTEGAIGQSFEGVGTGSNGEQGIWNYNSLPLPGTQEDFDHRRVSAFCYDKDKRLFVTYDNEHSAKIKARYVKSHGLGGGMWWESCGDTYNDSKRSVILNFVSQLSDSKLDDSNNSVGVLHKSSIFLQQLLEDK